MAISMNVLHRVYHFPVPDGKLLFAFYIVNFSLTMPVKGKE